MSYADLLWDSPELVTSQSQKNRTLFEEFIIAVGHRLQIQQNYSTQLKSLSLSLDKHLNKEHKDRSSIVFVLSAFKSDLVRRENQTATFVNHLRDEVFKLSKVFINNQTPEAMRLQGQILTITASYLEAKKKLDSAKAKLGQLDRARYQQLIKLQVMKARAFVSTEDKEKQTGRARYAEKQYKEFDAVYRSIIKDYNTFIEAHLNSLDDCLKVLQKHQQQRVSKVMDGMKKILVFESAMMRNFQYDIVNITNQLAGLEVGRDIKEFAEKYSKGNKKPELQNVPRPGMRSTVVYDMLLRKLQDKLQLESKEVGKLVARKSKPLENGQQSKQRHEENDYQIIREIVEQKKGLESNKKRLAQLLDKDTNRNYMQLYVRWHCQQNHYQTDQYIQILVQLLIEKSVAAKDVFCLRRVLYLVFTQFNLKNLKYKQKSLYLFLHKLPLWRSRDFWQAALFEAIQQSLKTSTGCKGEKKQDARVRQRMVILNQLADYCNMMVMLSFNLKSIKLLAGKFLRMYGLGEQQSGHLLKIINESGVAYYEVWESSDTCEKEEINEMSQQIQQTK